MLTQLSSSLKTFLTVSAMTVSTAMTIAPSNTIAADIQQGCESLGGTYHALETGSWMCLYSTPNHNGSLGVYCNLNQQCDRLVYSHRNGTLTLEWQPVVPQERTDD